jgi:hypothetical protein
MKCLLLNLPASRCLPSATSSDALALLPLLLLLPLIAAAVPRATDTDRERAATTPEAMLFSADCGDSRPVRSCARATNVACRSLL